MLRRLAPNTFNQVLQLRDTLRLDSAQVVRLTALREAFDQRLDTLAADVQRRLERLGNNADPQAMVAQLSGPQEEAQRLQRAALRDAQEVLTPAQWALLPPRIREPRVGLPGAGGQPRPGAAGGRRVP
jgi:hypothetical protein